MEAIIAFFSFKNGGIGMGIMVFYWVLWGFFYAKYKSKFDNQWIKVGIPAVLSYLVSSMTCFLISQDIRVFIYPIIMPFTTVLMEIYTLNKRPNPYFLANKDNEDQKQSPIRCFDVVLVFVITFLIHLLFRAAI
ncbi:MAG: hypothetical protein VR67_17575 [Peptococcaceae bacterium BRH_c8a]|nr:MAG: hypothetical protein VR67_17575 [Peptococcaceae bacterium BRH_c8a]